MRKVFGIGFHKTGTSSLRNALERLGYRVTGPNGVYDRRIAENLDWLTAKLSHRYDAFQDNPWPLVFEKMDKLHPGSKFILTVRDPDAWIRSQIGHFGEEDTPMRKMIYGIGHPKGNEEHFKRTMLLHNEKVLAYFRNRPDDLLTMDFTAGDGWEKLCRFLGRPVPDGPFPHVNKAADRATRRETLTSLARRARAKIRKIVEERTPF